MGQVREDIGDFIFLQRTSKKISQAGLARLVGVTRQYIHSIEKNKVIPSLSVLAAIANALKLSVTDVVEKAMPQAFEHSGPSESLSNDLDLAGALGKISKELAELKDLAATAANPQAPLPLSEKEVNLLRAYRDAAEGIQISIDVLLGLDLKDVLKKDTSQDEPMLKKKV